MFLLDSEVPDEGTAAKHTVVHVAKRNVKRDWRDRNARRAKDTRLESNGIDGAEKLGDGSGKQRKKTRRRGTSSAQRNGKTSGRKGIVEQTSLYKTGRLEKTVRKKAISR